MRSRMGQRNDKNLYNQLSFPWNGSKRWLLPEIAKLTAGWKSLPGSRYIEPFVGGWECCQDGITAAFGCCYWVLHYSSGHTSLVDCLVSAATARHLLSSTREFCGCGLLAWVTGCRLF